MRYMRRFPISVCLASLYLAIPIYSQETGCEEGARFDVQKGEPSTFTIAGDGRCTAALLTFSDSENVLLEPETDLSCSSSASNAQSFTITFGSNATNGEATINFQCGEESYCMTVNITNGSASGNDNKLQSNCIGSTNSSSISGVSTANATSSAYNQTPLTTGSTLRSTDLSSSVLITGSGSIGANTSRLDYAETESTLLTRASSTALPTSGQSVSSSDPSGYGSQLSTGGQSTGTNPVSQLSTENQGTGTGGASQSSTEVHNTETSQVYLTSSSTSVTAGGAVTDTTGAGSATASVSPASIISGGLATDSTEAGTATALASDPSTCGCFATSTS